MSPRSRLSRAAVARYLAGQLAGPGRDHAVALAAAWLAAGRRLEAGYLGRDVARILADRGYLSARVTAARPLTAVTEADVRRYLARQTGAATIELASTVDPALIGGVRLETPTATLDQTVTHRLSRLQGDPNHA